MVGFRAVLGGIIIAATTGTVQAAESGTTRFWNLTGETITHLNLAPTGTANWGPDQCRNDPDGSVDFDERLRITGVSSGRYDVKFSDKAGRTCLVRGVEVKTGAVFSLDKDAPRDCSVPGNR
jgi:hypothetical protein